MYCQLKKKEKKEKKSQAFIYGLSFYSMANDHRT